MGNEIAHPKAQNGLTLPLSKSLGSQDFKKHKAMVAVELEVLAKKFDRFGWDRDRGSMAHDRLITDWQDALGDYPLNEIKAACIKAVMDQPNKMPNEGHVMAAILAERGKMIQRASQQKPDTYVPCENPITPEAHAALMEEFGSPRGKVKNFAGMPMKFADEVPEDHIEFRHPDGRVDVIKLEPEERE